MIVALVVIGVGLAFSGPASVFLVLRYLAQRDDHDRRERDRLAQRIQAPLTAVAQSVADDGPSLPPVHFEDDEDFLKIVAEQETLIR